MSILKKTSLITTLSIVFITLIFLALHIFSSHRELMKNLDEDFRYKERLIYENLHIIAEDLELATKFFIMENPELITLFVNGKRDELYLRTKEMYESLNQKYQGKLAVMHFYKPGVESFLRMHKPEKFGDITKGHRPFLKEIDDKQLKNPLTGFEAGRFSVAYRVEVPLFLKDRYIGIIDYGIEVDTMCHSLGIVINLDSAVMLMTKTVEPIIYKEYKKISDNLVLYSSTHPLFETLHKKPEKNKITFLTYAGKEYALYAIPLFGHGDKELALYIMAQDITSVYDEWQRSILLWIVAAMLLIMITLTVFRKSFIPLIKELDTQKEILADAQSIAKMGNYVLNMSDNSLICSKEVFNIAGMETGHPEEKQKLEIMMKLIHPEDVKKFEDDFLNTLKQDKDATAVHRIIKKETGQIAYVMHRCKINKKANGALCTVQDITDLVLSRQAEIEAKKSLKTSENKFNSIADAAQDGIVMLDEKGMLSYCNPKAKEILGYDEEELKGKDFHSIAASRQYYEAYKKGYAEFVKSGKGKKVGKTVELSAIRKDGTEFPISLSVSGVKIKGKWHGIGIIRDISKIKETESQLKAKDEMMLMQSRQAAMGEMIEMIAHQWRQPLAVIAMAANNLQLSMELENKIDKEKLDNLINSVTEQTQKLSKIISDFTKHLEQEKEKKSLSIISAIDNTMKIMGKDLQYNNIEVIITNDSKSRIKIFEGELMQVFINLLNNAKDAVVANRTEDRKIDIKIYEKNEHIITAICDNGGGIPKENIKRLAEPYFSTKGENEKGLGLYVSKIIIQKHFNGHLTWLNRDKGACFIISLPLT